MHQKAFGGHAPPKLIGELMCSPRGPTVKMRGERKRKCTKGGLGSKFELHCSVFLRKHPDLLYLTNNVCRNINNGEEKMM